MSPSLVIKILAFNMAITGCEASESRSNKKVGVASQSISIVEKEAHFSSAEKKDMFTLTFDSTNLLTSQISFKIIGRDGQVLYEENFPSQALIGYGLAHLQNPSDEQKTGYIMARLNSFFDEENFATPAVSSEEEYDPDYAEISQREWTLLKNDSGKVAFHYALWEGDLRWITKVGQTVRIFRSCC